MKFLVLALCVCAASAASYTYKPWQPVQPVRPVAKAFAKVEGFAPEPAYKTFVQPAVNNDAVPVVVPKAVVVNAPIPVSKNAAYVEKDAAILRSDNDVTAEGFNFGYETQNGIAAQSSGTLKQGQETEFLAIQGSYQYIGPDGNPIEVSYVADENGFQPKSASLPVGPPTPEYIIRALEYIRTHPSKETN